MPSGRNSGLTLIELLIAMAIFAVMAASMFIAFDNIQKAKEVTDRASARLQRYQSAFNRIGQDMQQIYARPIRNEYGDLEFSLDYSADSEFKFTRTGWSRSSFFTKQQRSELQRVAYYLEDGKLMRAYWRMLDRAQGAQPERTELLDGVQEISYKFYYTYLTDPADPVNGVHEEWPPSLVRARGSCTVATDPICLMLPSAIEMKLLTEDLGEITRSYLVAAGAEYVFQ